MRKIKINKTIILPSISLIGMMTLVAYLAQSGTREYISVLGMIDAKEVYIKFFTGNTYFMLGSILILLLILLIAKVPARLGTIACITSILVISVGGLALNQNLKSHFEERGYVRCEDTHHSSGRGEFLAFAIPGYCPRLEQPR